MESYIAENFVFSYTNVKHKIFMQNFHYHNSYELYFLVEGTIKYIIGDEVYHVRKGNFVFVPKGVPHKTDSGSCQRNERMLVCFDESIFNDGLTDILNEFTKDKLISVEPSKIGLVTDILQKIKLEYEKDSSYKDAMIKAYIKELLILISRHRVLEKQNLGVMEKIVYAVSEHISEHFSEDIQLDILSRKFAISSGQLSRKFKDVMGIGLNEYIRYIRILNAEKLLKNTALPITDISQQCGFNDSNYFSTVFKKATGLTPIHYRKISCPAVKND